MLGSSLGRMNTVNMHIPRACAALVLAVLIILTLAACTKSESPLEKVTFMAGFRPQANLPFVAAYVANELGYFKDQGLDVDIRHSTGEHLKLLLAGDVDFTTAAASSVLKRRADPGLPIIAFSLFGQRGEQALIVLKESGIRSVEDWEDKTFGYKISVPPDYLAILSANGIDRSMVKEVRVGFDPRILTERKVDILAVFKSNEPDTLRRLGFEVEIYDAADYGVATMGLTFITREDIVKDDPDKVQRFLKAAMKGLEFAFSNTEETLDIVLKYAEKEDRDHMRFMLLTEKMDAISPATEDNGLGWMTRQQWQDYHDTLLEYGALASAIDVDSVYTDRFIKEIYTDGRLNWP